MTPYTVKKEIRCIERSYFFYLSSIFTTHLSKRFVSTHRGDSFIPIHTNDTLTFKSQLTSLYKHPRDYTFKLYDKNQDFFTSIASKILTLYHHWLDKSVEIISLQLNCLRPSIYDLKTDENDPSFLPSSHKTTHHNTNTTFLKHQMPKNYIFVKYKNTSPNTMYTIDHSGKLAIYEPMIL